MQFQNKEKKKKAILVWAQGAVRIKKKWKKIP